MFTGLVEETGEVISVEEAGEGVRVKVRSDTVFEDAEIGDSISLSGACLTVEDSGNDHAVFFLAEETLDKTWFSDIREGDTLNFERSLKAEDRMGGHYVQGHVEDVARVLEVEELEEGWNFRFSMPENIEQYIVEKGFVAVEGISLTVTDVDDEGFSVTIIPETWKKTVLSEKDIGDSVNVEADVMAKYAEKAANYL
ncbi:MAG: riboflavin synthase [Candidatus Nanohaloarchaea archaeon]